ncbi:MAG: SPOR domain-containing protein [Chlorobi bacterium]|nr:SPOR domain-containing protein [Chlorobiota bacterium]
MKKIIFHIILSALCFAVSLNAQSVKKKWVLVQSNETRKVFIDTTSIKETPRQVNVWTLVNFLTPRNFASISSPVYGIKYNYAFLRGEEKFSLIGAFFYDRKNRLISEQTTPITSLSDFKPVSENVITAFVYSKVAELLSTGKLTPDITVQEKPAYSFKRYSKKAKTVDDTLPAQKPELLSGATNDSLLQTSVSNNLFNELQTPEETKTVEEKDTSEAPAYDANNPLRDEIRKKLQKDLKGEVTASKADTSLKPEESKTSEQPKTYIIPVVEDTPTKTPPKQNGKKSDKPNDASYNSENEYNVTDNIWTDGNLYCVQVSAWRSKSKAEKIAAELSSVGYKTFVVKAFIPSRGQTWYRVRAGYFSSLEEAKSIAATLR